MQTNLNANPKSRRSEGKRERKVFAQTAGPRVHGLTRRHDAARRVWRDGGSRDAVSQHAKTGTRTMFMQRAIKRFLLLPSSRCNTRDRQWRGREGVSGYERDEREDSRRRVWAEGSGFVAVPSYYAEFRRFTDGLVCRPTNPRPERLFKRGLRFWEVTGASRKSIAVANPPAGRRGFGKVRLSPCARWTWRYWGWEIRTE